MSSLPHFAHLLADDVSPSGTLEVTTPFDQSPIATIDMLGADGVEQALAIANQTFRDKSGWLPAHRRVAILQKAKALMIEQAEHLALEAAREGGKPLIDSKVEVARAIDGMALCIEALRTSAERRSRWA